jgi:hypothetical protein
MASNVSRSGNSAPTRLPDNTSLGIETFGRGSNRTSANTAPQPAVSQAPNMNIGSILSGLPPRGTSAGSTSNLNGGASLPEPQQAASQRPRSSINSRQSDLPANIILGPRLNRADAIQQQHQSAHSKLSEVPAKGASVGSRNSSDAGATFRSDDLNLMYDNTNVPRLSSLGSLDNELLGSDYQHDHAVAMQRNAILSSPDERNWSTASTSGSRDSNDDASSITDLSKREELLLARPFLNNASRQEAAKKEAKLRARMREVNGP